MQRLITAEYCDRLFAQNIDQRIINLINKEFGDNLPFFKDAPFPLTFVDRDAPRGNWSHNWTTLFFTHLLKPLSLTGWLENPFLNGDYYGFAPQYIANLPDTLNFPSLPDSIEIELPDGESQVSWIERGHKELGEGIYCTELPYKISYWRKMGRFYRLSAPQVIEVDLSHFLLGSLVLEGALIKTPLNEEQKMTILYHRFRDFLSTLWGRLNISDCRILTGLTFNYPLTFDCTYDPPRFRAETEDGTPYFGAKFYPNDIYFRAPGDGICSDPVFSPVPDWFCFASLDYSPESNLSSLGLPMTWQKLGEQDWYYPEIKLGEKLGNGYYVPFDVEAQRAYQETEVWGVGYGDILINQLTPSHFLEDPWRLNFRLAEAIEFPDIGGTVPRNFIADRGGYGTNQRELFDGVNRGIVAASVDAGGSLVWELVSGSLSYQPESYFSAIRPLTDYVIQDFFSFGSPLTDYYGGTSRQFYAIHQFYPPELIQSSTAYLHQLVVKGNKGSGVNPRGVDWVRSVANITLTTILAEGNAQIQFESEEVFIPGEVIHSEAIEYRSFPITLSVSFWENLPDFEPKFSQEELDTIAEDLDPEIDPTDEHEGHIMPDSKKVEEIWAAIGAENFAYLDPDANTKEPRIANLGYYIERLARVWGISVEPDGSVRSIRQRRVLSADDPIPDGWGVGQWHLNHGGSYDGQKGGLPTEERDGIVYVQRANRLEGSPFNADDIELLKGGVVLCENWFQVWESYVEDLDKGLNWQEMGGAILPSPDGSGKYCTFEGLGTLLAETAYMVGSVSKNTSETFISSLVIQAIVQELLKATGAPLEIKYVPAETGDPDTEEGYRTLIPFPGLAEDAPTALQQTVWLLQNIGQIKGALGQAKA